MYTQCPNCNVIFSMSEDDLDKYQGLVRCGRCNEVFNASWNLVDSIPHEQPVGPGDITTKPEQKAVATSDAIDEFILDNVESDENSGLPSESAEASEQEQSLYSENELVDGGIDVEQGLNVAEPEPIEAATDTLPASDESLPTESILDEGGLEDSRRGDDMEGNVKSLDEDEPGRVLENEELAALDLDTEIGQADQDMEREAEIEEESKAIDPGLSEVGVIEAENDGLEAEPREIEATTEEILVEGPGIDDEESSAAESEPDEGEEISATDLELPEVDVIEAETKGLEAESPEAEATTEEIIVEEPGPDDELDLNADLQESVDKEKITWDTEADSESDIDRVDMEDVEQELETDVVASTESIVVDELDTSIQPPGQTALNELESFDTPHETSLVSDTPHTHSDKDDAIADVDSLLESEDASTGDIDDDTMEAIEDVLPDISEFEPVNDDVSEEFVPAQDQEETLSNVAGLPEKEDEADQTGESENIKPEADTSDKGVDSIKEADVNQFSVPDSVAEEIVIEAPTRLWRMDEEIGQEAGDKQVPGWSTPEARSVPASREAADVKRVKIPQPRPVLTAAWIIGSVVLLFGLVWQVKGHYLTDLAQVPSLRAPLETMCQFLSCTVPPRSDIKSIDLVSTSVDPHPVTPGALRVSANLINRAAFAQEFPPLEITLTDKEGQVVGRRTYLPHEYRVDAPNKMLPNVLERADFDLAQPDETAVGYEIQLVAR